MLILSLSFRVNSRFFKYIVYLLVNYNCVKIIKSIENK